MLRLFIICFASDVKAINLRRMVAHVKTVAFCGVEITDVEVQVHIASGLPSFTIVGLPDKAVAESRERVRVAIQALGLSLPAKRITVNLAPADLAKEGSHFDLPIALGVLAAMELIPQDALDGHLVLGELALDGRIMSVQGVLSVALGASARGMGVICPAANAAEASWAGGEGALIAPDSLMAWINHVKGVQLIAAPNLAHKPQLVQGTDMAQVKGHAGARRALEIAAAGGHNLLMIGPPGTGKSLLASCLPSILPELTPKEMLEISMIASIAGTLPAGGLVQQRPYRSPHHSASLPAMVGGGKRALPGELSLAHKGVIFLDELPEFPRAVLESLRQPLETREVTIARVQAHYTYPADVQLIAAMNPCRCGYLSDPKRACSKAPRCGEDYLSKLSGPLLDRFDLYVDMPMIAMEEIYSDHVPESSAAVRMRVQQARSRQIQRYSMDEATNANIDEAHFHRTRQWHDDAKALLQKTAVQMGLSMRGMNRVSRVAATISDVDGAESISRHAVAEALSYRRMMPQELRHATA